ncbi:RNA polymerase sigma factor [Kallipyga gabonensis]|uniref:RNA polymerase sigma factor n=1 Tax=Kallipyga gabonensis TaxID=1686287 RepID=UPI0006B5B564|nr:RNA polymerase sigma factor [Kallipyga gabonensis]
MARMKDHYSPCRKKEKFLMGFLRQKRKQVDQEKLSRLYQSYQQRLFYFAVRILEDPMAAEDAVQDAFLRIRPHLDKIDEEDTHKTGAFLFIVVKHIALDYLKKRKRETLLPAEEVEKYLALEWDYSENGDSDFEEAFRKLSFDHQVVLLLKYDLEFSHIDIAQFLHLSEVTVRKRCSRAKKRLNVLMERGSDHEKEIG